MPHTWGPKAGKQFQQRQQEPRQQQQELAPPSPPLKRPETASSSSPLPTDAAAGRLRVLFVCIGNSCRSQMAEGFARHYGSDVMEAVSAGIAPAMLVAGLSRQAMLEHKGIDISQQWPKSVFDVHGPWDIVVNISGFPLPPNMAAREVRTWTIHDPVADPLPIHVDVATRIEGMVQQLIIELRGHGR